ncbi:hypothetical protein CE91St52_05400 [Phascolarctobacterium faecium]|uniref:DUF6804 family protein n=1 Tax=Phascolarctobacterium faecium TaxID=33025 RepID=UPI001FCA4C56|nr:DUF6804 family protein [Phascolarctobacterium faecium]BDE83763.1 hypothetical protein CE91St52_05400 [Phascolarctobacterium faecium]BDE92888.1 hypothetical protein CE91St53_05400 [Phascolarctobacterium faecium]
MKFNATYITPLFALYAGFFGLPSYGWYEMLRITITLQAIIFAWVLHDKLYQIPTIFFIATAILFNPFAKIRMSRSDWEVFDIIIGIAFLIANFWLITMDKQKKLGEETIINQNNSHLINKNEMLQKEIYDLNEKIKDIIQQHNKELIELKYKYNMLKTNNESDELKLKRVLDNANNEVSLLVEQRFNVILSSDILSLNHALKKAFKNANFIILRFNFINCDFEISTYSSEPVFECGHENSIKIFSCSKGSSLLTKETLLELKDIIKGELKYNIQFPYNKYQVIESILEEQRNFKHETRIYTYSTI